MQDPNWQRIKQLFTAAAALPPEQHAAFLQENEPDAAIRAFAPDVVVDWWRRADCLP